MEVYTGLLADLFIGCAIGGTDTLDAARAFGTRIIAFTAVLSVGLEIDAITAIIEIFGASADTFDADLDIGADLAAVATILCIGEQIDAAVATCGGVLFWTGDLALSAQTALGIFAGLVTLATVNNIGFGIYASPVAESIITGASALTCLAGGGFIASLAASSAVQGVCVGIDATTAAISWSGSRAGGYALAIGASLAAVTGLVAFAAVSGIAVNEHTFATATSGIRGADAFCISADLG